MSAPSAWGADEWLAWLRRGPKDEPPHWTGLRDCAAHLTAEIEALRSRLAAAEALTTSGGPHAGADSFGEPFIFTSDVVGALQAATIAKAEPGAE